MKLFGPLGVAAAMVLFALCVHRRDLLLLGAPAGLGVVAWSIHRALADRSSRDLFGLEFPRRTLIVTMAGATIGLALAIAYRQELGRASLPTSLAWFALPAMLIGSTEELLYRGYLTTCLRPLGWPAAIVLASLLHTAYKCALFAPAIGPAIVDVKFLATVTFLGGLAFGALRWRGRSVLPAALAHALFDLVVYGDAAQAPWWIWG